MLRTLLYARSKPSLAHPNDDSISRWNRKRLKLRSASSLRHSQRRRIIGVATNVTLLSADQRLASPTGHNAPLDHAPIRGSARHDACFEIVKLRQIRAIVSSRRHDFCRTWKTKQGPSSHSSAQATLEVEGPQGRLSHRWNHTIPRRS